MRPSDKAWIENQDGTVKDTGGAGQAGDTQDLPTASDEAEESVQDLVETGQDFEAELIEGMEEAADHPEEPATTHEDRRGSGSRVDRS